jgi:hypothetical protein
LSDSIVATCTVKLPAVTDVPSIVIDPVMSLPRPGRRVDAGERLVDAVAEL